MFNPPPADLASRDPFIYVPPITTIWHRSHLLSKHPIFFGKGISNRWDAPASEYGVLYLASDPFCAFMESIGRGVLRTRLVPRVQVQKRGVSQIRVTQPLRLIDLVSSGGLARIGAEGSLASGSGYKTGARRRSPGFFNGGEANQQLQCFATVTHVSMVTLVVDTTCG